MMMMEMVFRKTACSCNASIKRLFKAKKDLSFGDFTSQDPAPEPWDFCAVEKLKLGAASTFFF